MLSVKELPALVLTAPGRCRLRRHLFQPAEPLLWRLAGARRRQLPAGHCLVAVTGSFGKTTTARAIRCALGLRVDASAGPNSGDALARALLAQSSRASRSVFEVGIGRPGQMAPMADAFRPTIAVVTAIGTEHRASLATLERTRDEKFELVRALAPHGTAVLNGDDEHVRWMAERAPGRVVTFGFREGVDVRAEDVRLEWPHGSRVRVRAGSWRGELLVRLFGNHSVSAVLAAFAAAQAAGADVATTATRLAAFDPTPGRMQVVPLASGATLLRDEYKSGLETIHRAIDLFVQLPAARRIVVLGEITEPPVPQRPHFIAIGQRLAPHVDRAILLGKVVDAYRSGLRRGGLAADRIVDAGRSWRRAFEALDGTLQLGDVVLVKGRHDERLERVSLAMAGRRVGCELVVCNTPLGRCDTCPMLERGWGRLPPAI